MEQLYVSPSDTEPQWWLHIKCRKAHELATDIAQMDALAAGARERAEAESAKSVVDISKRRLLLDLANASSAAVTSGQEVVRAWAELEKLGIDPNAVANAVDRFTREKGHGPATIEELDAFIAATPAEQVEATEIEGVQHNADGTVTIPFAFTAEEDVKITAAADKAGVSVEDLLRQMLIKHGMIKEG